MTDTDIDELLSGIENEFKDELECLTYIKPSHYTTQELLSLQKEWRKRYNTYRVLSRSVSILGLISVISLFMSLALYLEGYVQVSRYVLVTMFFSIFLSMTGFSIIIKKYGAGFKQDYIWNVISKELKSRKEQA